MKIQVLKDSVINQIAAGEVVDRPVSVVRELVENAIDAEASEIQIHLENGGRTRILVRDNGEGMVRDDALLALERHATSKLNHIHDLRKLGTMGFRGEALPSIASVSRITLQTKTKEQETGAEIRLEGGKILSVDTCTMTEGTVIDVRNLFFNIPARKKFLRQPGTETARVREWLQKAAVPHYQVRFRLFSDEKEILNFPRCESLLERANGCVSGNSVEVNHERFGVSIQGVIGHPSQARFQRQSLGLLVNGRPVTDRMLMRAVREGFDSTLKSQEYPVGILCLHLDSALVDVNVHPQKNEVRFERDREVFRAVREAVFQAVRSFRTPVQLEYEKPVERAPTFEEPEKRAIEGVKGVLHLTPLPSGHESTVIENAAPLLFDTSPEKIHQPLENKEPLLFANLRYVGQIFNCYLLCESEKSLHVIDMHAAHERVRYNQVRDQFETKSHKTQTLMIPITIQVGEEGQQRVLEEQSVLEDFGFEVESFGSDTIVVRGVPDVLLNRDIASLFQDLAALPEGVDGKGALSERVDHISARIACHSSIRSGKKMKREEVYKLLEEMDKAELSNACPHGRPVIVSVKESELEKWFGRTE